jgi:hypothetical protein
MPVHFFTPPARVRQAEPALAQFIAKLEAAGEHVVSTMPYGALVAIFTTSPATSTGQAAATPGRPRKAAAR